MTRAITSAEFAASQPHADIGGQGFSASFPPTSAVLCGAVPSISPMPNCDGSVSTLAQLNLLLAKAERQRNLRQSKAASISEAELRALRHDILRAGAPHASINDTGERQ